MQKSDSVLAILVQDMKETVTLMINVKKISDVEQIIALIIWEMIFTQIAVMLQLSEMRIFVLLMNLVEWMKVTVTLMINVKKF